MNLNSVSEPLWHIRDKHPQIESVSLRFGLHPCAAQVLLNRVEDENLIEDYLNPRLQTLPHPQLLSDIERASALIIHALKNHISICVYGDYDVDGTSSSAILVENLRAFGGIVNYYLPHRLKQGYGLHESAVQEIYQANHRLLITCDLGVSNAQEVLFAKSLGLSVIIVDHHQVPQQLPDADAVINPHRPDDQFPFKNLCAAGVCFYLMSMVRALLKEDKEWMTTYNAKEEPLRDLRLSLDLVALATVADMVPLTGINRILVARGLEYIRQGTRPGLAALARVCEAVSTKIDAQTLAFKLGPRINAAGRMGSAMRCVDLFLSDGLRATDLATQLDQENNVRRETEESVFNEACAQAEALLSASVVPDALVLFNAYWHPGVLGIVASRLVERFFKPVIVIGQSGKGSARSVPHLHLLKAIEKSAAHLLKFGGHHLAAGVTVKPGEEVLFRQAFSDNMRAILLEQGHSPHVLSIDGLLAYEDLNDALIQDLARVGPFGSGNPEPVFALLQVAVKNRRLVGQDHLKLELANGLHAIAFKQAQHKAAQSPYLDLAVTPFVSEYLGRKRIELRVKAMRLA